MQSTTTPEVSPPKPSNVTKTFGLVAMLTVISKFAGFARDVVVAEVFGTTAVADAYNYAYLFTGNILVLFGGLGGPFHSATVTILSREKDKPEAGLLMTQVFIVTAIILSIIACGMFYFAPILVQTQVGNYAAQNPEAHQKFFESTVLQLRWMSPLIVISGLIGITYGILNVYEKLFWPSISPLIASVAIIIGVKLFVNPSDPDALPLSLATMFGAFGQIFVQMPDLAKCKLPWRLSFKADPLLKDYLLMLAPACLGTLVGQLTTYVDSSFAGQMTGRGDWTAIINANRLVQLPLGILSTAMLVPMLPRFSALAKVDDTAGIKLDYKKAFQFLIFLSMPLAALLTALPEPIVTVLFQRGNFTSFSVGLVGEALWWLAPSIMCYLGRDLVTRVFYAFKDSRTPFLVAAIAIAVKYLLDWYFIVKCHWSVGGISLATSFITVLNLSLLTFFLRKKIGRLGTITMLRPVFVMLTGGVICGALSAITFLGWQKYCSFELKTDPVTHAKSITRNTEIRFKWEGSRIKIQPTNEEISEQKMLDEQYAIQKSATPNQSLNVGVEPSLKNTYPSPPSPPSISQAGKSPTNLTTRKKFDLHNLLDANPSGIVKWLSLAIGIAISSGLGMLSYLAICFICKLDELQMLRRRLPNK